MTHRKQYFDQASHDLAQDKSGDFDLYQQIFYDI